MSRQSKWLYVLALCILICGAYVAFIVENAVKKENSHVINNEVHQQLNKISYDVVNGITKYQYGLRGLLGAIEAAGFDDFTYEKHLTYFKSRNYAREFPGARGFGLIKIVKQAQLNEFLTTATIDRKSEFVLKQLKQQQDPLFIIQYIEPEHNNSDAVGFDIGSEDNRRTAALKAASSGLPQLTAPITLVQANEKNQHGLLLLLAVYKSTELSQEVRGWVYAPLVIDEILQAVSQVHEAFSIGIADVTDNQSLPFYSLMTQTGEQASNFQAQGQTDVFGRQWLMTVTPSTEYIKSLSLKDANTIFWLIIGATCLLTLTLCFMTAFLYQRLQKLKHQAAFNNVLNNATDCIIGVDRNFAILHWNTAAEQIFDFASNTTGLQTITPYLSPSISSAQLNAFFKKVAQGESVKNINFEYQQQTTNTTRQLNINISPIFQNDTFWGATINIHDETEIHQLQRIAQLNNQDLEKKIQAATIELNKQLNFQKNILDSENSAIIACDSVGVISLLNESAETLLACVANETIGKINIINLIIKDGFSPDVNSKKLSPDLIAKLMSQQDKSATINCALKRKSGELVKVSLVVTALEDENKQLTGYLFIADDISEKIEMENNMKLVSAAIDCSSDILLWVNKHEAIYKANPRAVSLSSYIDSPYDHLTIHNLLEFNSDNSWTKVAAEIIKNKRHTFEAKFKGGPHTTIPILVSGCVTYVDEQRFIFLAAKDISPLLEKEQQLKSALSRADVASKAKSNFIANMSHELRTPLNAANGFLQMLEFTEFDELQRKHVAGTKLAITALTQTVNEILEITDAEKNQLTLELDDFMMDELLDEVGMFLYETAKGKPLEIHFNLTPEVPYVLNGDKNKLKRILLNLGGNAVKFSKGGEILINISVQSQKEQNIRLNIVVKDTGIGIESDKLASIFNIFTQVNNESSRQYGGLGVGLTIVNQYVQFLGGEITVNSELGVGSEFSFDVLMYKAVSIELSKLSLLTESAINVLLVDDNPSSLSILGDMIKLLGWKVTTANNANDALVLFQSALNRDEPYDLALLDWKMPQTDGWELAKLIRKVAPGAQTPLLIMVTAHSREMFTQNRSQAPSLLNGFLTKPVTRSQMINAFYDAVASAKQPPEQLTAKLPENALLSLRILIVEDNPTNQNIAKALLESQGANTVISSGGEEALFELKNGLLPFDVVLMDIQMPDIDGYETTRHIRAIDKFAQLPILAMTANVMPSDKEKCLAAGMNGHIGKPFELAEIVEQILDTINKVAESHCNQEPPEEKEYVQSEQILRFCAKAEINLTEAMTRFSNMEAIYLKSLGLFTADLQKYIDQLQDNSSSKDDLKLIFHTLKSTAGALGFTQLAEHAKLHDQTLSTLEANEIDINYYQNFVSVLADNLNTVHELILLLQNKSQPQSNITSNTVDFAATYNQLTSEINSFNMRAIDTFQLITTPLKNISTELADELSTALNRLKFNDAKEILIKLDTLITEKNEHASS